MVTKKFWIGVSLTITVVSFILTVMLISYQFKSTKSLIKRGKSKLLKINVLNRNKETLEAGEITLSRSSTIGSNIDMPSRVGSIKDNNSPRGSFKDNISPRGSFKDELSLVSSNKGTLSSIGTHSSGKNRNSKDSNNADLQSNDADLTNRYKLLFEKDTSLTALSLNLKVLKKSRLDIIASLQRQQKRNDKGNLDVDIAKKAVADTDLLIQNLEGQIETQITEIREIKSRALDNKKKYISMIDKITLELLKKNKKFPKKNKRKIGKSNKLKTLKDEIEALNKTKKHLIDYVHEENILINYTIIKIP